MIDHNSPITNSKQAIMNLLKSRFDYVYVKKSYVNHETDFPLKKPLITISKGKGIASPVGFGNYLKEEFDEENYEFVETKGSNLKIRFDIHIWNGTSPKLGGSLEIERLQEQIQSIVTFESSCIEGITLKEFEEGEVLEDPNENDLFHSRCVLTIEILWKKEFRYEVIDEIVPHGEITKEV